MQNKRKKNLLLVGAGGHSKSCIEVLKSNIEYKIYGLLDNSSTGKIDDFPILGKDSENKKIFKNCKNALITVGQIKNPKIRINLYNKLKKTGFSFPIIKANSAIISKNANFQEGTILMNRVFVNSHVNIGINCIINSGSIIEHDVSIKNFCHISTGAIINGDVKIGNNTFIGSGTVIKNGITIGNNVVISAGKFINKNIKDNQIIK